VEITAHCSICGHEIKLLDIYMYNYTLAVEKRGTGVVSTGEEIIVYSLVASEYKAPRALLTVVTAVRIYSASQSQI